MCLYVCIYFCGTLTTMSLCSVQLWPLNVQQAHLKYFQWSPSNDSHPIPFRFLPLFTTFSTQHTEWPASIFWYLLLLVMVYSYFTVPGKKDDSTNNLHVYVNCLKWVCAMFYCIHIQICSVSLKCAEIMRERFEIAAFSHSICGICIDIK